MSNINKEELMNYLNNQKDMCKKLHYTLTQPELNIMNNILDDIISFVEGIKREDEGEVRKGTGYPCVGCSHLTESMYSEGCYRCDKYNLLMLGIPSSNICPNND